ncbi:hypothetical protein pb186bvf_011585 [Paramecium bursaria]
MSQNISSPTKKSSYQPATTSKSPIYIEYTQQKGNPQLKQSHITSKYDREESEMRQSTIQSSEFEIRKLMNLVELQQHEISNWRRRYEQVDARLQSTSQTTRTLQDYEKHLDQLTQELKSSLSMNDDLVIKLKLQEQQIVKTQKLEESALEQVKVLKEELNYYKEQNIQLDQDLTIQMYQKDTNMNQQLILIQDTHQQQIQMMDDQVQQLQDELVKRNQSVEFYKGEISKLDRALLEQKQSEAKLLQQFEQYKQKQFDFNEDKKKELQQKHDEYVRHLKNEYHEEKNKLLNSIQQLEYQNQLLSQEIDDYRNLNDNLENEIQLQSDQNRQLQDNLQRQEMINLEEYRELDKKYQIQQDDMKMMFKDQLDGLIEEVSKLQDQLNLQQQSIQDTNDANDQLKETIDNLNEVLNHANDQINKYKNAFEDLQEQYNNDVDGLNQEVQNLEDQNIQLEQVIQQKNEEVDQLRILKNQLAIKSNDNNLIVQKLQVEIECQRQKLNDLQRQQEINDEVRDEIKKSQIDQVRRQLETKLEMIESENRTLRHQFEVKAKECEEWKSHARH